MAGLSWLEFGLPSPNRERVLILAVRRREEDVEGIDASVGVDAPRRDDGRLTRWTAPAFGASAVLIGSPVG
jgi:hypothetical protein